MKRIIYQPALALLIGGLMMISSCSKNESSSTGPVKDEAGTVVSKIKTIVNRLPHVKSSSSAGVNKNVANLIMGGWDFSNPSSGYQYSSPYGTTYTTSSNTFNLSSNSLGGNVGGTVVAGSTLLDINYTFCFTYQDSVSGLNVFNTGAPNFGVAAVIGVSGDFSKLASSNSNTDFSEIFHGLAFYIVYDHKASGSYDVIDWTDPSLHLDSISDLNKKAFAFVLDFKNGKMYLSNGGKISVNGGTMNFDGNYLEISNFIDSNGNYDLNHITYSKVSGYGAMGCS